MNIDLRSDTITKPTPEMLEAMFGAEVGDDVFDGDPTVKLLETKVAGIFGKEAALFCPSGTMTNQIAVRINTDPQDQVICDKRSHVYNYEGGGLAYNSLVSVRLVDGDRGRFTAKDILDNINPDNIHFPRTKLVILENTVNKGGGSYYILDQIEGIYNVAKQHNLKMHLDGARLFNALAETAESPETWGNYFDTVSVCLSKGLGAPVGSVLAGTSALISKAKRVRKVLGGGMRQAGYLAAAGIYALDHHLDALADDNRRARMLGGVLESIPVIERVHPVDTNIIILELIPDISPVEFIEKLRSKGVFALPFGGQQVRMVTHLEITDEMIDYFEQVLNKLFN
ncbi:MAG: threonine aldolase [Cyclobacteriaceae bacterium]|nr:MAG: threonine aldolase [Cyclobacteriaceae bacterium]